MIYDAVVPWQVFITSVIRFNNVLPIMEVKYSQYTVENDKNPSMIIQQHQDLVAKHQEELEKLSKELEEKEKIKEELEAMQNVGFSALIILISLAV